MGPMDVQTSEDDNQNTPHCHMLPPCRVCGEPGTGFHYGITSCVACKGFFRRSLIRKESYECFKNYLCRLGPHTSRRDWCQKCRYEKCLAVGMSREGCKVGRYSLLKRSLDTQEAMKHRQDAHGVKLHRITTINDKQNNMLQDNFPTSVPPHTSRLNQEFIPTPMTPDRTQDDTPLSVDTSSMTQSDVSHFGHVSISNFDRRQSDMFTSAKQDQEHSDVIYTVYDDPPSTSMFHRGSGESVENTSLHKEVLTDSMCYSIVDTMGVVDNDGITAPSFTELQPSIRHPSLSSWIDSETDPSVFSTGIPKPPISAGEDNGEEYTRQEIINPNTSCSSFVHSQENAGQSYFNSNLIPNDKEPNSFVLSDTYDNEHSTSSPLQTISRCISDENDMFSSTRHLTRTSHSASPQYDPLIDRKARPGMSEADLDQCLNPINPEYTNCTFHNQNIFKELASSNSPSPDSHASDKLSSPDSHASNELSKNYDQSYQSASTIMCLSQENEYRSCLEQLVTRSRIPILKAGHPNVPKRGFIFVTEPDPMKSNLSIFEQFPFASFEKQSLAPLLKMCYDSGDWVEDSLHDLTSHPNRILCKDVKPSFPVTTHTFHMSPDAINSHSKPVDVTTDHVSYDPFEMDKLFEHLQATHCRFYGPESAFLTAREVKMYHEMFMKIYQLHDSLKGKLHLDDNEHCMSIIANHGDDLDKKKKWFTCTFDGFDDYFKRDSQYFRALPGFERLSINDRIVLTKVAYPFLVALRHTRTTNSEYDTSINEEGGVAVRITTMYQVIPSMTEFYASWYYNAQPLRDLGLTFDELIILATLFVMCPDSIPDFEEQHVITEWHNIYMKCLLHLLRKRHGPQKGNERFDRVVVALSKAKVESTKIFRKNILEVAFNIEHLSQGEDSIGLMKEVIGNWNDFSVTD